MIISKNWLNEYIDLSEFSGEQICEKLNSIGLEVDSHQKISLPPKIVVAKVESCKAHENSDHLHVCEVNIGSENLLQIVCGAPNVAEGQFVACALVGAVMSNGLEIKKAKLRGVESSGMLCSSSELGLPKINDGIMILDESIGKLVLGKELRDYDIFSDDIIEVELTPNRGDCLSIFGVARDLSAGFNIELKKINTKEKDNTNLGIGKIFALHATTKLKSSFLYKAIELKSPLNLDLKTNLRLAFINLESKNQIQKALDYATYETGVIFRAYDYAKLNSNEQKITFDIKELKSGACEIFLDKKSLGVAGVYQDKKIMPDDKSNLVLIEASYCDPVAVSIAICEDKSMPKDDLSYRTTRGSEPDIEFGSNLLFDKFFENKDEIAVYSGKQTLINEIQPKTINFSCIKNNSVSSVVGEEISKNDIANILKKLGFNLSFSGDQNQIIAKVPPYRHDVNGIQDICEEIVRITGINNIKAKPLIFEEKSRLNQTYFKYKNAKNLRLKAVANGFFECVHYVFDNPSELEDLGFDLCEVEILNPISNELSALKPTLINHLLNSSERNVKNSKKSIKLFEYGEVFDTTGSKSSKFGFLVSGLQNEPSLLNTAKPQEVNFFYFAGLLQNILGKFELKKSTKNKFLSEFEQADIYQNGKKIGFLGRLNLSIGLKRDLPKTYVCELDFDKIIFEDAIAKEYSKFPSISRDLSLIVPKNLAYFQIRSCIDDLKINILKEFLPVDIYEDKSLGNNISLTLKFAFQDDNKTLQDEEIAQIMDQILDTLKTNLNIGLR